MITWRQLMIEILKQLNTDELTDEAIFCHGGKYYKVLQLSDRETNDNKVSKVFDLTQVRLVP
jgi:hypothetical protein